MITTYDKIISDTASKYNIPSNILHNLIQQESGFNPNAVSPAGAQGIAQFMPATAKGMGINPLDPNQAIPAAGQYLANNYKQFGNWPSALAAYNAGPGAVQKYGGVPPYPETQNYVKNILGMGQSQNTSQPQQSVLQRLVPQVYAADSNATMNRYEITNPITGEKKVVSLDHEPTQPESDKIFNSSNQSQSKAGWLNPILQMAGGGLGAAGGGAIGVAGGAMVPGADLTGISEALGGYAGAVGGAGVGAGAGNATADWIRKNLLGDKTINSNQTLSNSIDAGKTGALAEGIGVPVAKGLGFLAHPIAPFIDRVNTILSKSDKNINFGEVGGLLREFETNILPKFFQQGKGPEAKAAFNDLSQRVTQMIQTMKPHIDINSGQDINNLTLPVAAANQIKRNLYQLVQDYGGRFGEFGNTQQQVIKNFASATRDAVAQAEPGVKIPNAIASAMYKVPETAQGLASILSAGQPGAARAINTVSGLPFSILQKLIPKGGGYLNQAIPRLLQPIFGMGQDTNSGQ